MAALDLDRTILNPSPSGSKISAEWFLSNRCWVHRVGTHVDASSIVPRLGNDPRDCELFGRRGISHESIGSRFTPFGSITMR